jgi:hypothetical protein
VTDDGEIDTSVNKKVVEISDAIARGARAFLLAEYKYMFIFLVVFGVLVLLAVGSTIEADPDDFSGEFKPWVAGALSMVAFVMGGVTSIASGYVGMMIAVQANSRTALQAQRGYVPAFRTAFRAGAVLGFALCGLALIVLFILIMIISSKLQFPSFADNGRAAVRGWRQRSGHDGSRALASVRDRSPRTASAARRLRCLAASAAASTPRRPTSAPISSARSSRAFRRTIRAIRP